MTQSIDEKPPLYNSLYGSTCGEPPFTNYTSEFHGTIDYIFYSPNKVIPIEGIIIDKEKMKSNLPLPSIGYHSDHRPIGGLFNIIKY